MAYDANADQENRLQRAEVRIARRKAVLRAIWTAAVEAHADQHTLRQLEKWLAAQAAPLNQEEADLDVLRRRTRPVTVLRPVAHRADGPNGPGPTRHTAG